jgi:hypothetical protein
MEQTKPGMGQKKLEPMRLQQEQKNLESMRLVVNQMILVQTTQVGWRKLEPVEQTKPGMGQKKLEQMQKKLERTRRDLADQNSLVVVLKR